MGMVDFVNVCKEDDLKSRNPTQERTSTDRTKSVRVCINNVIQKLLGHSSDRSVLRSRQQQRTVCRLVSLCVKCRSERRRGRLKPWTTSVADGVEG